MRQWFPRESSARRSSQHFYDSVVVDLGGFDTLFKRLFETAVLKRDGDL